RHTSSFLRIVVVMIYTVKKNNLSVDTEVPILDLNLAKSDPHLDRMLTCCYREQIQLWGLGCPFLYIWNPFFQMNSPIICAEISLHYLIPIIFQDIISFSFCLFQSNIRREDPILETLVEASVCRTVINRLFGLVDEFHISIDT